MTAHRVRQFELAVTMAAMLGNRGVAVAIGGAQRCPCAKPLCQARWFPVTGETGSIGIHTGAWVIG